MSLDINDLNMPQQTIIERGEIDKKLRGIAELVPHASRATPPHFQQERDIHLSSHGLRHDFNRFAVSFGAHERIKQSDIEKMAGFNHLIAACFRNDVCVEITNMGKGNISVAFDPEAPYAQSVIFGVPYANVTPVLFGIMNNSRTR